MKLSPCTMDPAGLQWVTTCWPTPDPFPVCPQNRRYCGSHPSAMASSSVSRLTIRDASIMHMRLPPAGGRPAGSALSLRLLWRAVVDVLRPHDVVLAEVAANLHLDQLQGCLPGVLQAMPLGGDDVDG